MQLFLLRPQLLSMLDEIELEVTSWEGISARTHKYGGLQFDYLDKEIGHLHSNGLLDILFSFKIKEQLREEGRIQDHHVFVNTGWITFGIRSKQDIPYALCLLKRSYLQKINGRPAQGYRSDH
nr:luciferase family protein [Pedobacter sp. SYSU D00535]